MAEYISFRNKGFWEDRIGFHCRFLEIIPLKTPANICTITVTIRHVVVWQLVWAARDHRFSVVTFGNWQESCITATRAMSENIVRL